MTVSIPVFFDHLLVFLVGGVSKLGYCIFILLLCLLAIRISRHMIRSFFQGRLAVSRHVDASKATTLGSVVSSIATYTIWFVGICSILIQLGVPSASLAAVLGTGTVAIGLAAQNVIKDIIAGFFILLEDQFFVGNLVTLPNQNLTGTVEEITIRVTRLRAADGTLHIVPNGSITVVSNMCKEYSNAIVEVDVAYEEDLTRVLGVLKDEMHCAYGTLEGLRKEPTVLGVTSLGDSGITIRMTAECQPEAKYAVERALRLRIKNRFDQEHISIPYPQCVVHMAAHGAEDKGV